MRRERGRIGYCVFIGQRIFIFAHFLAHFHCCLIRKVGGDSERNYLCFCTSFLSVTEKCHRVLFGIETQMLGRSGFIRCEITRRRIRTRFFLKWCSIPYNSSCCRMREVQKYRLVWLQGILRIRFCTPTIRRTISHQTMMANHYQRMSFFFFFL